MWLFLPPLLFIPEVFDISTFSIKLILRNFTFERLVRRAVHMRSIQGSDHRSRLQPLPPRHRTYCGAELYGPQSWVFRGFLCSPSDRAYRSSGVCGWGDYSDILPSCPFLSCVIIIIVIIIMMRLCCEYRTALTRLGPVEAAMIVTELTSLLRAAWLFWVACMVYDASILSR